MEDETEVEEVNLTNGKLQLNDDDNHKDPKPLLGDVQDDDNDGFHHQDPFPVWRLDRLARPLCLLGLLSLLLGLTVIAIGVASFIIIPTFKTRHSFQVESKWTNFLLIFTGICAILSTICRNLTTVCATLIFSLLSSAFAFSTSAVHVANYYFRMLDSDYYELHGNGTEKIHSESVGRIYLVLASVSGVSCLIAAVIFTLTFYLIGRNCVFKVHIAKHSLRLTVLGLVQVIVGLLITGLWLSVEVMFTGEGVNLHALPSSEVLSHGLVVLCAGMMLMLAMGKGTRPLLLTATVMQGLVFVVTTFYGERPLSVMAFSLDQSQSMLGGNAVWESRMAVCIMLGGAYVTMMLFSIYCFAKCIHQVSYNKIARLANISDITRRRLRMLSYGQCLLALVYAIVDIMAVGLFVLYKLDFTPLPLFILSQGIYTYFAMYTRSPLLVNVSVVVGMICGVFSIRDLYLFVYHISVSVTPDTTASFPMTGGKLAVHLVLVFLALIEIGVAIYITVLCVGVLINYLRVTYNRVDLSFTLCSLKCLGVVQMLLAVTIIVLGFLMFLGKSLYIETFGDVSISKGLLMFCSALFLLLNDKRPSLILSSLFAQIFLFTIILLQSDSLAYFIDNHLGLPDDSALTDEIKIEWKISNLVRIQNQRCIAVSFANFALFLGNFLFIGVVVLLLGRILEQCRFSVRENDINREEMVTIKAPPSM